MLYFIPHNATKLLTAPGPKVSAVARHFRPSTTRPGHLVQHNDAHTKGFVADIGKPTLDTLDTTGSKRKRISVLIAGHTAYVTAVAHIAGTKTVIGSLKK
jgi:hypothetical protein